MHRSKKSIKQLEVLPLCIGAVVVKRDLRKKVCHRRSQRHNRIKRRRAVAINPRRRDGRPRFIQGRQQCRFGRLGDAIRVRTMPIRHLRSYHCSKIGIVDICQRIFFPRPRDLAFQPVPVGLLQNGARSSDRGRKISRQRGGFWQHGGVFGGPHRHGQYIGTRAGLCSSTDADAAL